MSRAFMRAMDRDPEAIHSVAQFVEGFATGATLTAPALETISSRQNPLVIRFREVTRARRRARTHLLLDGVRLVTDALRAMVEIEAAIVAQAAFRQSDPAVAALVRACQAAGVALVAGSERVMSAVSRAASPSRAVALATHCPIAVDDLLRRTVLARGCVLAPAGVQDPGNLGAIVRAADAAGASGVIVSAESADPFGDKALRGAMGSTFRIPVADVGRADDLAAHAAAAGCRVVAATPRGGESLYAVDLRPPTVVMIGGEGGGIDPGVTDAADVILSIPMADGVDSLNAAVAAALVAYEARRQRTAADRPAPAGMAHP
ncbi:MAG: RNA methyltransferase [Acidobacteria bacterium]|nr:RNA methyltransferase [Acidobacteriota bacterium]MYJ04203.1 RNA methyltransferase [Acidobacteriota bacterium]